MESSNGLVGVNGATNGVKVPADTSAPPEADARSHRKTFSAYQHTIYMNGVRGLLPPLTTDPNGWEAAAKAVMEPRDFDYAKGGAGAGETIRKNREAFQKWSIVPRMVRGNTERSLKVTILGQEWPSPVAIAPVGVNKIFHPYGIAVSQVPLCQF